MKLLVQYSDDADNAYNVILYLKKLENHVKDVETSGYGYMLTRDTSFLDQMKDYKTEVSTALDSLRELLKTDTVLWPHFSPIYRSIRRGIVMQDINTEKVASNDTFGFTGSLNEGEYYMNQFRNEVQALEREGVKKSAELDKVKKRYEAITPKSFSIILVFSGAVTLISFFYIIREMKIRILYQKELEQRLHELNRSYAELEQFTFVASHDLQEPLRKIRTFSDRLASDYSKQLDGKGLMIIERMNTSAERLQALIQDITDFTTLINKEELNIRTDLSWVVQRTLKEYGAVIEKQKIEVHFENLPIIAGYPEQLLLLFKCLVDNSIKFSSSDRALLLKIKYFGIEMHNKDGTSSTARNFHKITIEDNGIGFENEFVEKIFMIFQRLHTQHSNYQGKGMGLAIAQRIMVNHRGFITAKGNPGKGALFSLYFPVEEE
jgi:signal transduction histidine kinase